MYGFHALKVFGFKIYVIVMGNVFNTPNAIHEKYDLKVTAAVCKCFLIISSLGLPDM